MTSPDGHREHFDGLFERHFRPVLASAHRRVDEPADAADVAAETFLLAWRRLGDIPGEPDTRPLALRGRPPGALQSEAGGRAAWSAGRAPPR